MQSGTARSETVRVSAQLNLRVLRWDGALPGFVLVHGRTRADPGRIET